MSVDNMKDMMHHTQKGQVPNWLPTEMWAMTKKYLSNYQHEVLPYCTRTGSDQTRRDAYDLVKLALWTKYTTNQNLLETKKGRSEKYNVHLPKSSFRNIFRNMKLWGVMEYELYHSKLALEKAKVDPKTFTAIDLTNKALIVKKDHHVTVMVYAVGSET
jgi:hypothetical protein